MNILFDGNYLFHKTLSVFKQSKETDAGQPLSLTEVFKDKENQAQFFRKTIIDFCSTVRQFDNVESVLFVFDNHSWRKKKYSFYKNKERNEEQKINDELNKEGKQVWLRIMEKFIKHITKIGFPVTRMLQMEGDDLCYFYAKEFDKQNKKLIVVSGDKDLLQFLTPNIFVYRNNSKCPALFYNDLTEPQFVETLKQKVKKLVVEKINPRKHLFEKILKGDGGDNVPAVFKGMGDKTAEKIYNLAVEKHLDGCEFDNVEYSTDVVELIIDVVKKAGKEFELAVAFCRNLELMWLHNSVYTSEDCKAVEKEVQEKINSYFYCKQFMLSDILEIN